MVPAGGCLVGAGQPGASSGSSDATKPAWHLPLTKAEEAELDEMLMNRTAGRPEDWQSWAKRAARLLIETFARHKMAPMEAKDEWARGNPEHLLQTALEAWNYPIGYVGSAFVRHLTENVTPLQVPFPVPDQEFLSSLDVLIAGDSSAHTKDPGNGKVKTWKSDLEYALTSANSKRWAKITWVHTSGGTIVDIIGTVRNYLASKGNPEQLDAAVVVSWFLNEAFTKNYKLIPGTPQGLQENILVLIDLLRRFRYPAVIVGGSSKLWKVDSEFDDLLHYCRKTFHEHGIVVDSGLDAWGPARMAKDGWHLAWEDENRKVMAQFFKALMSIAVTFHPPGPGQPRWRGTSP